MGHPFGLGGDLCLDDHARRQLHAVVPLRGGDQEQLAGHACIDQIVAVTWVYAEGKRSRSDPASQGAVGPCDLAPDRLGAPLL